jgi:hypothetical protein
LIPTAIWNVPFGRTDSRPSTSRRRRWSVRMCRPPAADLDQAARQPNHINGRCFENGADGCRSACGLVEISLVYLRPRFVTSRALRFAL